MAVNFPRLNKFNFVLFYFISFLFFASQKHTHTGFYRPRKLGHSFPRLYDIVEGEAIATLFLQLNPEQRMGAEDALNHPYFAPLPRKLFELPDGNKNVFVCILFLVEN